MSMEEYRSTAEPRQVKASARAAELQLRSRPALLSETDARQRSTGACEVGGPIASIKTTWRTACEKAGVMDLHFHDLGREFACRLLESRAELHDVRDFLGHTNLTTTSRYLRSTAMRLERVAFAQGVAGGKRAPAAHGARGRIPAQCHTRATRRDWGVRRRCHARRRRTRLSV